MTTKEALTDWANLHEELAQNIVLLFSTFPISTDDEREAYRAQIRSFAAALDSELPVAAEMLGIRLSPAELTATVDKVLSRVAALFAAFPENGEARQ